LDFIPLVVCSLGTIVAVFAYIFLFRLPTSQINAQMMHALQDLYMRADDGKPRTTLLLRSRETQRGQLSALVVWLNGLEVIDLSRQILPKAFEQYFDAPTQSTLWRATWDNGDYDAVQSASREAFANKLEELKEEGWHVVFDLPFSLIDHLVYLEHVG
jgi:hypothetical protein